MTEQNKTRVSGASPEALAAMARIEEKMREDFQREQGLEPKKNNRASAISEAPDALKPSEPIEPADVEREARNASFSIPIHREKLIDRPGRIGKHEISAVRGPSKDVFAKRNEDQARANAELAERHKHDQEVQRFLQPHSLYGTLQAQARLIDKLTKKVDSLTRAVKKLNSETNDDN